jgi:hypothetical protein
LTEAGIQPITKYSVRNRLGNKYKSGLKLESHRRYRRSSEEIDPIK